MRRTKNDMQQKNNMEVNRMLNVKDILNLKEGNYPEIENEDGFIAHLARVNIYHSEYLVVTDFEGTTKIYSYHFIKLTPESFIEEFKADFQIEIEL